MTEAEWLACTEPQLMLDWLTRSVVVDAPTHAEAVQTAMMSYPSDRKLRLFACACCRQVWDGVPCVQCNGNGRVQMLEHCLVCRGTGRIGDLTDPRSRRAVEVAERIADGMVVSPETDRAQDEAQAAFTDAGPAQGSFEAELAMRCLGSIRMLTENAGLPRWFSVSTKLAAAQAALLRDIFNPFSQTVWRFHNGRLWFTNAHGVSGSGEWTEAAWYHWHDGTIPKLAQAIYDDHRFGDMPILADALEEAGCANEEILQHCRGFEWVEIANPAAPEPEQGSGWIPLRGPHVRGCWVIDLLLGKS